MGYYLQAIISSTHAMEVIAGQYEHAFPQSIGPDLALLPHVKPFLAPDDTRSFVYDDYFWFLYESLASIILEASDISPVAYVEADYSGGVGGQSAIVWSARQVVFGPEKVEHKHFEDRVRRFSKRDSPISQALHHLGVRAIGTKDEFDAVRLGRIRHTLLWTPQEWRDQYADGYR